MAVNSANINVEPCDVVIGRRERTSIQCVADVAGSLNDTYFVMSTASTSTVSVGTHYVWINVNSAGSDPAVADMTGIEVAVATGASAATVASAIQVAVDAIAGFNASVTSGTVIIEINEVGYALETVDTGSTGFTLVQVVAGIHYDLGGTSGGITFNPEISTVEVKADQLGETLLGEIKNGTMITASMTLLEMNLSRWSIVVGSMAGDSYTPAGGTEVVGYGTSKRFDNLFNYAYELRLRPSGNATAAGDYTFFKAYAIPSSINLSGTELKGMEVEFKVVYDSTRTEEVNLMAYGDATQNLLI